MRVHNSVQGVGVTIGRRLAFVAPLLAFSPVRFPFIAGAARLKFPLARGARFSLPFRFRSAERFALASLAFALASLRFGLLSFALA